jgi:Terpene synthase family 2, C-terminal metal binding
VASRDQSPGIPMLLDARGCGQLSAVAGQIQRDLIERAAAASGLFAAKPFDPALFGSLATALAYSAPWLSHRDLRVTGHASLWAFALDWRVDVAAGSGGEVRQIEKRCLEVADGAPPDDDLGALLAELRDELAAHSAFTALRPVWRDELAAMLDAMAREWEWKSDRAAPTLDEYLLNADNLGFCFVFITHLVATADQAPSDVEALRRAARSVQRVIRLLNDLATVDRDVAWGDLNALLLDEDRPQVGRRLTELTASSQWCIDAVRPRHPRVAAYLERQRDFCAGFYAVSDFWGAL